MLQVAKDAARLQQRPDLLVERALARMRQVVNGKAGDDTVERTQSRQRAVEVVVDKLNARIAGKRFWACANILFEKSSPTPVARRGG